MAATSSMRTALLGYWRQARPWQRLGYLVGVALPGAAFVAAVVALRNPTPSPA
jgi:hypothetical protein